MIAAAGLAAFAERKQRSLGSDHQRGNAIGVIAITTTDEYVSMDRIRLSGHAHIRRGKREQAGSKEKRDLYDGSYHEAGSLKSVMGTGTNTHVIRVYRPDDVQWDCRRADAILSSSALSTTAANVGHTQVVTHAEKLNRVMDINLFLRT